MLWSLVAHMVRNLPAMQETRVQSLGREDPLEKGMATHSSILAWRIPRTEEPSGLWDSKESDTTEQLTLFGAYQVAQWRRQWQLTPVLLPGESQGQRSLVGCCLWGSHRVGHD